MRILDKEYLDFDDVLILPKRSFAASRKEVDLRRHLGYGTDDNFMPIISANMSSTGTIRMASTMNNMGCVSALHKFHKIEDLVEYYANNDLSSRTFYTLGTKEEDVDKYNAVRSKLILAKHPGRILIDVANGYTQSLVDFVKRFRDKHIHLFLMVGNVATPEMVQELIFAGANCVKIGIGSGANCITRKVAGVGVPQLSAVIECADAAHGLKGFVCSDGGCRMPGDVAKAFVAGADFVMLGNGMLGGTDECDGEWQYDNSEHLLGYINKETGEWVPNRLPPESKAKKKAFKSYGMSSDHAMEKHYGQKEDYKASEGKVAWIPYRGSAESVVKEILGGLRSCGAYIGANRIKDFSKCGTFVKVNRTHNTVFGDD